MKMNRHLKTDSTGKPHRSLDTFEHFSARGSSTHSSPHSSLTSGHGSYGNSRSSTREHDYYSSGYSSLQSHVSSRNSTGNLSYSPPLNRSGTSSRPSTTDHTHLLHSHAYSLYNGNETSTGFKAPPAGSLKSSQMNDLSVSDDENTSTSSTTQRSSEHQRNVLKTTLPKVDISREKSPSDDSEYGDPPDETLQADEIVSQEENVLNSHPNDPQIDSKLFGVSLGPPPPRTSLQDGTTSRDTVDAQRSESPSRDKVDNQQNGDSPALEDDSASVIHTDKNKGQSRRVDESIRYNQTSTESETHTTKSNTTEIEAKQLHVPPVNTSVTSQGQSSSSSSVRDERGIVSRPGFEDQNEHSYSFQEDERFSEEEGAQHRLRFYLFFSGGGQDREMPRQTRHSPYDLRAQDPVIEEVRL